MSREIKNYFLVKFLLINFFTIDHFLRMPKTKYRFRKFSFKKRHRLGK